MSEDILFGLAIVAATIAGFLLLYLGARWVFPREPEEKTSDLAASVLFRIATLHALVLALVFASEIVEYQNLELQSAVETNAISDVYYDAGRYAPEDVEAVRAPLRAYVSIAAGPEWEHLGANQSLTSEGWAQWDKAYNAVLDLEPGTLRQTALRENMLRQIHVIAENRDLREHHAKSTVGPFFWFSAIIGVMLFATGYYCYPPKVANIVLITFFASYTGFILFTIYAMSNPFGHPGALQPVIFEALARDISIKQN